MSHHKRLGLAIATIAAALVVASVIAIAVFGPATLGTFQRYNDVVGDELGFSPTCQLYDHKRVSHGDYVAVIREANCPGSYAQGTDYYVVFVHRTGESNSKANIALQFEPSIEGTAAAPQLAPPPQVAWGKGNSVIVREHSEISEMVMQRNEVEGIHVHFDLGKVDPWL